MIISFTVDKRIATKPTVFGTYSGAKAVRLCSFLRLKLLCSALLRELKVTGVVKKETRRKVGAMTSIMRIFKTYIIIIIYLWKKRILVARRDIC